MIKNITYSILNSNNIVVVSKDIDSKDNFSSKLEEKIEEKIEEIQPVEKTLRTHRQNEREDAQVAYNRLRCNRMVLDKL